MSIRFKRKLNEQNYLSNASLNLHFSWNIQKLFEKTHFKRCGIDFVTLSRDLLSYNLPKKKKQESLIHIFQSYLTRFYPKFPFQFPLVHL